jgi:hypothetical protein
MKPHEETWQYDPRDGVGKRKSAFVVVPGPNNGFFGACEGNSDSCGAWAEYESSPEDHARARLAAQAPAMARLLMEQMDNPLSYASGEWWTRVEAVLKAAGVIS